MASPTTTTTYTLAVTDTSTSITATDSVLVTYVAASAFESWAQTSVTDIDPLAELTLTIAVRNGDGAPVFTGTPSPTATVDGITCTVEGSVDLAFPNSVVTETDPPTGLPALPSGWEYRRFRLNASNGLSGSGFLRVRVAPQP